MLSQAPGYGLLAFGRILRPESDSPIVSFKLRPRSL